MIICLIGKTSSGKNTISDLLTTRCNIPQAISTTTRPMRKGEKQDKEYHFITKEEFDKRDFIETREYQVYNGDTWYYGYEKNEFNHDNCIAIVDVQGYFSLKDYFGDIVIPFYIYASEDTLRKRLILRGDDPQEIDRRLSDDEIKFKDFIQSKDYYKICNDSNDINLAVQEIEGIIKKLL